MHIDDIVAGLLKPVHETDFHSRVELIIRLAMWLRYSGQPDLQESACLAGFLAYVRSAHKDLKMNQLPQTELELLQRNLRIDLIASIYLREHMNVPDFELFAEYDNGHHDYLYLADIVRFLIWYAPISKDKREQASLQKAYYFIQKWGFRNAARWSRRWLVGLWARHRNASSILYTNFYHSDCDLLLDPRNQKFRDKVDALAANPTAVVDLLLHAKWVGQQISQRLHNKAKTTLQLLQYPSGTEALAIPQVILDKSVYDYLKNYDPFFELK